MVGLFFGAIVNHWLFSFGGVVLLIFAIAEKIHKKDTEEWLFLGGAIVCLFIACYGAWVDEHQNTQTVIEEKARETGDLGECKGNSKSTNAQNVLLQSQVNSQQGTLTKMQQGVNSQQATFNLCVTTLAKTNAPVPRSITLLKLQNELPNTTTKHSERMVVLTNEPITPVRLFIWCDHTIKTVTLSPLGDAVFSGGAMPISSGSPFLTPQVWQLNMSLPTWSPEQPLLVTINYDEDNLGQCYIKS